MQATRRNGDNGGRRLKLFLGLPTPPSFYLPAGVRPPGPCDPDLRSIPFPRGDASPRPSVPLGQLREPSRLGPRWRLQQSSSPHPVALWVRPPTPFLKWPLEGSRPIDKRGWRQVDHGYVGVTPGLEVWTVFWSPPPPVPQSAWAMGKSAGKGFAEAPGEKVSPFLIFLPATEIPLRKAEAQGRGVTCSGSHSPVECKV